MGSDLEATFPLASKAKRTHGQQTAVEPTLESIHPMALQGSMLPQDLARIIHGRAGPGSRWRFKAS